MAETIQLAVADGIATLTLDVPGRSMNVVTDQFLDDLNDAVEKVVQDDQIIGASITSAKDAFVAWADLMWLVHVNAAQLPPRELLEKKVARLRQALPRNADEGIKQKSNLALQALLDGRLAVANRYLNSLEENIKGRAQSLRHN